MRRGVISAVLVHKLGCSAEGDNVESCLVIVTDHTVYVSKAPGKEGIAHEAMSVTCKGQVKV